MNQRACGSLAADHSRSLATLGPKTLDVLMDVTNQCNLKCRMCYFSFPEVAGRSAICMSPALFSRVAEQLFASTRMLVLSAGCEPLVHHEFSELLSIVAPFQIPEVRFLTNGQLLLPDISRACIESGVSEIHVSIDGATQGTYEWVRRGASFERLIENLGAMAELKRQLGSTTPVIQFNVTLMRCNVDELPALVRLARSLGVEQLSVRHLMPYDGLGIEDQCLHHDRLAANAAMGRGLKAAADHGVRVVMFPEPFSGDTRELPPWARVGGAESVARHPDFEVRAAVSFAGTAAITMAGDQDQKAGRTDDARGRLGDPPSRGQLTALLRRSRVALARGLRAPPLHTHIPPAGELPTLPFGAIDEPAGDPIRSGGELVLGGWALHRAGVQSVLICRRPLGREQRWRLGAWHLVPIATARRHTGTRPDISSRYPHMPDHLLAGWTCRIDTSDLPASDEGIELLLLVRGLDGRCAVVASRRVSATAGSQSLDALYCKKPFISVYIDAAAMVYPYPDCQTVAPFGQLGVGTSFEQLWFGPAFTQLRQHILDLDPPSMCRGCPDFVNRNPDDPDYFVPRGVVANYRLPLGVVDSPPIGETLDCEVLHLQGWAAGFSPIVRVELLRDPLPGESDAPCDSEGLVSWCDAWLGLDRPDVKSEHNRLPEVSRAGWAVGLLGWWLPDDATGLTIHVRAHNADGAAVRLATLRFRLWNDGRLRAERLS